jgi:hypothetical protein
MQTCQSDKINAEKVIAKNGFWSQKMYLKYHCFGNKLFQVYFVTEVSLHFKNLREKLDIFHTNHDLLKFEEKNFPLL